MKNFAELAQNIVKPELFLTVVTDRSGSMEALMPAVKRGMKDLWPTLAAHPDANVMVQVIAFDATARTLFPDFKPASEVAETWTDAELTAGGGTEYNRMCDKLAQVLDDLKANHAVKREVCIMVLTDGMNTDGAEKFQQAMERLRGNRLFQGAIKAGIAVGENSVTGPLEVFCGNPENVYKVRNQTGSDLSILASLVKVVTRRTTDVTGKNELNLDVEKDEQGYVVDVEDEFDFDESIS